MKLKTQEDIRRIEIICLMILSILKDKNIPVGIDIKVLYMIVSTIYDIDLLTVNYTQRKTEEYKELKQCLSMIMAIFSLVPTPSVPETSTGRFIPARLGSSFTFCLSSSIL